MSAGERRLLHGEIAAILEELHAGHTAEKVVQLARHYLEAGKSGKALHYLLQAGDEARRLYAFEDASRHYEQALDILKRKGDYEGASRILMKMGLTYYGAVDFNRSQRAYRDAFMLLRQADLSLQMNLPAPPHPLRITMPSIITLDPIMITDTKSEIVASQLFGRLLNRTPDLNVMPDIAESWEILEDGRTFLFHLRDNVVWSDGQPLTAEDFVFAMHLQLEPGIATAYPEYWDEVQGAAAYRHGEGQASDLGIEALDPFTLKVRLVHPSGPFLQLLVYLVPLPRHAIEIHGQDWTEPGKLVTSGPFLLDSWKKERSLVLKRNPAYYGQFSGNVDQVELLMYSKPEEYLEAYQADELDILPLSQMGPANMSRAIYEHAADYVTFPDFTTERLTFNTVRPPFDDVRVRRALVLAIDRQKLTEIAEKGLNSPATGGLIPEGLPGHLADTALPYDPERAQQLLAEAGYPNGRDLPRVTGFISKFNEHLPEFLNKYWKDNLELQVVWKILDWDTFVEYDKGNQQYHMYLGAWSADHPDPDTFLRVLMQVARSYWPNETYYEIAETARHTMDHNKRMHLYQQAEEILLEEAPIMPLFYLREHLLIKPWIKNYRFRTMGQAYWKDIIIEPH